MTSGRNKGEHNKSIMMGMSNLQILFKDKTNILRGLTKEEIISLYYKIPIKKVVDMRKETLNGKWQEISYVKKNLIKSGLCAIDFKKLERNVPISNEEFGVRKFDRKRNIFFKISDLTTADDVGGKYIKLSKAFRDKAEDIHEIGIEAEQENKVIQQMQVIQR